MNTLYRGFYNSEYDLIKFVDSQSFDFDNFTTNHQVLYWKDFRETDQKAAELKASKYGQYQKTVLENQRQQNLQASALLQ